MNDRAKLYKCSCGGFCLRPVADPDPRPCDRCDAALDPAAYTVEDMKVLAADIVAGRFLPFIKTAEAPE